MPHLVPPSPVHQVNETGRDGGCGKRLGAARGGRGGDGAADSVVATLRAASAEDARGRSHA